VQDTCIGTAGSGCSGKAKWTCKRHRCLRNVHECGVVVIVVVVVVVVVVIVVVVVVVVVAVAVVVMLVVVVVVIVVVVVVVTLAVRKENYVVENDFVSSFAKPPTVIFRPVCTYTFK
jgi:hypothetical protein